MSGFGNSGFGGQQAPHYGQSQQQQQQNFQAGGFGSSQPPTSFAASGFGNVAPVFGFGSSSTNAAQGMSNFGNTNNTASFGSSQALNSFGSSAPSIPFGNSITATPFATANLNPSFASHPPTFGASAPSYGTSSGMNVTASAFIPASFSNTSSTIQPPNAFLAPVQNEVSQASFLNFGGHNTGNSFNQTPFGAAAAGGGFGGMGPASATGGFGTSSSVLSNAAITNVSQSPSFQASPFGTTSAAPAPAIIFGASSMIAPASGQLSFPVQGFTNDRTQQSFQNSSNFTSTPFGATAPRSFGNAASGPPGLGRFGSPAAPAHYDSSAAFGTSSSGFGNTTFGSSQDQQLYDESMADGGSAWDQKSDMGTHVAPVPYGQNEMAFGGQHTMNSAVDQSNLLEESMSDPVPDKKEQEDKLASLKAKLAAKKKKLEEHKQRKLTSATPPPTSTKSPSPLDTTCPVSPNSSLADRNSLRFSQKVVNTATRSQMPSDLVLDTIVKKPTSSTQEGKLHTQLDLEYAVALVGTCPHMCPDHELRQREQEGDIQLLEIPQPGTIHPQDWNLRQTAVKRFRRSAADYKLDIPEWVRPPDVLERTCSYLEEWVMERDRQGPDPRFTQAPSPPPLDVYQFIWDRTRMIRKDFILQNFVGSGGQCDARAVRCHERIARWHAMCEHQLSHIPDFVRMQSQQNIAELGQAMKTLNQFYDDSLRRSTVEVPDEAGTETRTSIAGQAFGCQFDIVQGVPPVDYDGTPLNNDKDKIRLSDRLIGAHTANGSKNTTAEPEMRGLYILLTLDNDNGMEVLSYAAELSRRRPEIFLSKPVQLAMEVFKAKHEVNYARFFSILRSPSTPYLFSCLMFKHVEEMRKVALRTMCATYGYRRKDSEPIYDNYLLKDLTRLLCFESMDEARIACGHYNITVKDHFVSSTSSPTGKKSMEFVFWKRSKFREPKDEERGIIIRLRPWKMVNTIERKLKGATRLAVCRGEVSGPGATLSKSFHTLAAGPPVKVKEKHPRMYVETQPAVLDVDEDRQMIETKQELFKKEEEETNNRREAERKALEIRLSFEAARAEAEEAKKRELFLKRKQEEEMAQSLALEDDKRRTEVERLQMEAEVARMTAIAAEEERNRKEAEIKRAAAEKEVARITAEKEERQRMEEETRKAENQRLLILEEMKQLKAKEEHLRQLQILLLKERREQEERRRNEEAERREWEEKIDIARKIILWRRLRQSLHSRLRRVRTRQTLSQMITTLTEQESIFSVPIELDLIGECETASNRPVELFISDFLELLCHHDSQIVDLASLRKDETCQDLRFPVQENMPDSKEQRLLVLLKVAVVIPRLQQFDSVEGEGVYDLLHEWIGMRLKYGKIHTRQRSVAHQYDLRVVVVNGAEPESLRGTDMALLVIPPAMGDAEITETDIYSTLSLLDESVSITVLNLDNGSDERYGSSVEKLIAASFSESVVTLCGNELHDFEQSLVTASESLMNSSIELDQVSRVCIVGIHEIIIACLKETLWTCSVTAPEVLLERARATLLRIPFELETFATNFRLSQWFSWPSFEFAQHGVVPDYFGEGRDLPLHWQKSLMRSNVEPTLEALHSLLLSPFERSVGNLVSNAPDQIKAELKSMMVVEQFQRCLDCATEWWGEYQANKGAGTVYLPAGMLDHVVEGCIQHLSHPGDNVVFIPEAFGNFGEATRSNRFPLRTTWLPTIKQEAQLDDEMLLDSDCNIATNQVPKSPCSHAYVPETPALLQENVSDGDHFLARSKRALDNVAKFRSDHQQKRQRDEYSSNEGNKSRAFTEKLEAMYHGDLTSELRIGGSTLSTLLLGAPAIQSPPDPNCDICRGLLH